MVIHQKDRTVNLHEERKVNLHEDSEDSLFQHFRQSLDEYYSQLCLFYNRYVIRTPPIIDGCSSILRYIPCCSPDDIPTNCWLVISPKKGQLNHRVSPVILDKSQVWIVYGLNPPQLCMYRHIYGIFHHIWPNQTNLLTRTNASLLRDFPCQPSSDVTVRSL